VLYFQVLFYVGSKHYLALVLKKKANKLLKLGI